MRMSQAADFDAKPVAHEVDAGPTHWRGPAIGAAILTVAWAVYLFPVFFGIMLAGR
jgi:hypothetical protein